MSLFQNILQFMNLIRLEILLVALLLIFSGCATITTHSIIAPMKKVNVSNGDIDTSFSFSINHFSTPYQNLSSTFRGGNESLQSPYFETANAFQAQIGLPSNSDSVSIKLGYSGYYNPKSNTNNPFPNRSDLKFETINFEILRLLKYRLGSTSVVSSFSVGFETYYMDRDVFANNENLFSSQSANGMLPYSSLNFTKQYTFRKAIHSENIFFLFSPGGTIEFGKRPFLRFHYWTGVRLAFRNFDLVGGAVQSTLFTSGAYPFDDIYHNRRTPIHVFTSFVIKL